MINQRTSRRRALFSFFLIGFLSLGLQLSAQDGAQLFQQNCASCHGVHKDLAGPALSGLESRGPWGDRQELYKWIKNPAAYMANDEYTSKLKDQYEIARAHGGTPVT